MAVNASLGVVKSQENKQQWSEIVTRLETVGVNYCIVDADQWQEVSDLGNVRVLLLPNVPILNGAQVNALNQWLKERGKVIVTGPTGNLSDKQVQAQLRSLLGAYWAFSNSTPTTLEPIKSEQQSWARGPLSSTLIGGVLIPTSSNSKTAAVWLSQRKPAAVIVTDKSTFLGWRWGIDGVASPTLDKAWLQAALNRYGLSSYLPLAGSKNLAPTSCKSNGSSTGPNKPLLPKLEGRRLPRPDVLPLAKTDRSRGGVPVSALPAPTLIAESREQSFLPIESNQGGFLSPAQVNEMNQELESLIARFESTLLAAAAKNSRPNANRDLTARSYKAVLEAKESLKKFRQLIGQQNYGEARQQWLEARRNLWDNYPTERQFAQPEIRAIWLDRGTIVQAKSEADLAPIFDRLAQAGINTVFFETINASYPIYPSRIAPEQNPLTRGWDPLKAAVKLAHQRGMELHAWVWTFAAANQRHNLLLNQPLNYLGPVLSRNPDWAITDKEGNPFDHSRQYKKAFFDPANPQVRNYLLSLLEEIATNYDVDGIQLDYIRYPFQDPGANQTFGYSNSSRWLFKETEGVDPIQLSPKDRLWGQWTTFRMRQVDSFVAAASRTLKEKRPDLILSVAVFPIPQRERIFRLQQNWEEWSRYGWVDLTVLMTYALDTGNLEEMTRPLFEGGSVGSSLLIPGLRLLKVPDPVTIDQMQYIRNMPTGGYALFATENLTPDLESIFNRTQGAVSARNPEPLPYRQPFKATAARYQALQQEWSFLLVNERLRMNQLTLKEWSRQVDGLAVALNQLAQKPSRQNYNSAQAALSKFRRQFGSWMRQQRTVQPYQVQVWENRLDTLERLLAYGERRILP
jgi:uncharacterized lipoprotein YddW (UPF0748 family)